MYGFIDYNTLQVWIGSECSVRVTFYPHGVRYAYISDTMWRNESWLAIFRRWLRL